MHLDDKARITKKTSKITRTAGTTKPWQPTRNTRTREPLQVEFYLHSKTDATVGNLHRVSASHLYLMNTTCYNEWIKKTPKIHFKSKRYQVVFSFTNFQTFWPKRVFTKWWKKVVKMYRSKAGDLCGPSGIRCLSSVVVSSKIKGTL